MKSTVLAGILLKVWLSSPLVAQSSWCRYQPGTLRAIIQQHRADIIDTLPANQRHWVVNGSFWGTKASVIYLGRTRHLESVDSTFLDGYLYRVAPDTAFRALFHNEGGFVEGQDTLWLAIQDSLIPELAAEAQPGDVITLFTSWLGAHQEGSHATWVFVVNEFATPKSQSDWDQTLASCPHQ